MEFFFLVIALITAGLSLAMGSVSLMSGLSKDGEKVDVVFGVMCLSLFIFFILSPIGFVWLDKAPYPGSVLLKRVFNFLYACLMPWFILFYTGYKKKLLPIIMDVLYLTGYIVMFFTTSESQTPLWLTVIIFPLALVPVFGYKAVRFQFLNGERQKAKWLALTLIIFLFFFIPTSVNQFSDNYFGKMIHAKVFYPLNLFSLAFILLMGIRLRANSNDRFRFEREKFQLERLLRLREMRWDDLLHNMQLFIVRLDLDGNIKYINPYAVRLLGFQDVSEILEKNWFDLLLPSDETLYRKSYFQEVSLKDKKSSHQKNEILCQNGTKKTMSWSNLPILNDEGLVSGSFSIGTDVTDQENAFLQINELKAELEKENLLLKGEPLPKWMESEIIGESEAILYAIQKAKQVAQTNATVLLEGETGVGKELFAELIQRSSLRRTLPFVKINCGAIPADLIEDELFGHEKGAFTGALMARKGRFELAHGGTIFLDELGELPLILQTKLLRVLQAGEFERVGGQETLKVDVRIIAATNRNLEKEVKDGRFRSDLYYRVNVFPITIPPLRSRKEDIHLLIQFYIDKKSKKYGKQFETISKSDIKHLIEYDWPGNIRELKNIIERAVISGTGRSLKINDILPDRYESREKYNTVSSLENIEKEHILKILNECAWRIEGPGGAAELLTIHPSTLRSRMKKLKIARLAGETS
jgi:formate hydrogenlyase transcriptional activator